MKKTMSILLALALALSLLAGCGGAAEAPAAPAATEAPAEPAGPAPAEPAEPEAPEAPEPVKIGVIFNNVSSETLSIMSYYQDYLGPKFNAEFVFSEMIVGAEDAVAFIESAYAAGCQGIIDGTGNSVGIASVCEELGMYWVANAAVIEESLAEIPYYLGSVGIQADNTKNAYVDIIHDLCDDGEQHNILILSGNAPRKGSDHENVVVAVLSSLQEIYGLTYTDDIQTIANSDSELQVETGSDVKIYLLPGFPYLDTYFVSFTSLLQSGDYDTVICAYSGMQEFTNVISETEKALGMDIKITNNCGVSEPITEMFNSVDNYGNTFINAATIRATNLHFGTMFAVLYNGITGHADEVRQNGRATAYYFPNWVCMSADDYNAIAVLDNADGNYVLGVDEMEHILYAYNSELTADEFQSFVSMQTADYVTEKFQ